MMERLWAPWRKEYIEGPRAEGCIFCDAASHENRKDLVVKETALSLVMLNKYPYNSAHLLISPKRHFSDLEAMKDEEALDVLRLSRHSVRLIKKQYNAEGFNVGFNIGGASGAGVKDHLHLHIVPRWQGDTNFMPVIADTKVMPEHMKRIKSTLKRLFSRI
jgi:ATP adenylyltransferase